MANENMTSTAITSTKLNPFYEFYSHSGHSPMMLTMYGILAAVCYTGICLNLILVITTIRSKTLRGSCYILLAFHAFTSCGILFGYSVKFGVLLTGANFIPLNLCYKIYILPLIGLNLATTAQLCIGLDRLLTVLFPIWYKTTADKCIFITIYIFLCCLRTAYFCLLINNSIANFAFPTKPVMCSTGDLVLPDISQNIYIQSLVLFIAEFLCYTFIWMVLWCRKSQAIKEKKLMVSLTVSMGLSLFCYIQGSVWRNILPYLNFDPFDMEYFVAYPTTLLYAFAFSSNLPILVVFSSEYRTAFRNDFLRCILRNSSHVTPVQNAQNAPPQNYRNAAFPTSFINLRTIGPNSRMFSSANRF